MANIKHFSDLNGQTIELVGIINGLDNAKFEAAFPGIKGRKYDGYSRMVGRSITGELLPVTRSINYKSFPSRHECDARCMNATDRTMNCECSCGGKNHGKGNITCAAA